MAVVRPDKRDVELPAEGYELLVDPLLLFYADVLYLEVEAPVAKDGLVLDCRLFSRLFLAEAQAIGHLAVEAGREGDEPLVVCPQEILVHPGFIVEALGI